VIAKGYELPEVLESQVEDSPENQRYQNPRGAFTVEDGNGLIFSGIQQQRAAKHNKNGQAPASAGIIEVGDPPVKAIDVLNAIHDTGGGVEEYGEKTGGNTGIIHPDNLVFSGGIDKRNGNLAKLS
jgi:hypothetical protein